MAQAASTSTTARRPPCPSASHHVYPDSALARGSPSTSSRAARKWAMAVRGSGWHLSVCSEGNGAPYVDGHLRRHLVQAGTSRGWEEGLAAGIEAHGTACRIRSVEQRLGRGVSVRRPEHACAESVARDYVGLMKGQIRHELHGAARPVRRKSLGQAVETRCHGQQADVHLTRSNGRGARRWFRRPLQGLANRCDLARDGCGRGRSARGGCGGRGPYEELGDVAGRLLRLEVRPDHAPQRVDGGAVTVDENGHVARGSGGSGHDGRPRRDVRRQGRRVSEEEQGPGEPWVGRRLRQ